MSPTKVFIVFDWYQQIIVGSYSSLEKAKEYAEYYEVDCKRLGREAKWMIIENIVDGDPTPYSNVVYDDCFENQK